MKENNKIDELFLKALADYRSELPSENTKKKIFGKLDYYRYLRWSLSVLGVLFVSGLIWAIYNYMPVTIKTQTIGISYQENKNNISDFKSQKTNTIKSEVNNLTDKTYTTSKSENTKNQIVNQKFEKKQDLNITSEEIKASTEVKTTTSSEINSELITENNIKNIESLVSKQHIVIAAASDEEKQHQINSGTGEETKDKKSNSVIQKGSDEHASVDGLIKKEYKKNKISRLELILGADFHYVDKKLSAAKEYDNLVKIRKESEKPIFAFSPTFGLRYNFNNFFLQSGFQYQKYGEKMDIQTSELKYIVNENWFHRDSLYYVKDSVNPPGAWHIDTIWFVTYDSTQFVKKYRFQKNNTYHYIEIPFLIGKKFNLNPFILEVSTGISFGLVLKSNAEILATDTRSVIVLNNEKSPYFNQLMLNYLFRLSLRYNLSQRWSIYLSPDFKYNLGSVFDNSYYPVKQNYIIYGIGSGLIYKF